MDIASILKSLDQSVLTEETASAIAEAFNSAVEEKVQAKLNLQVESALLKMDEDHADKLNRLVEALDLDHTEKLKQVVEAINENHAAKLAGLVNIYKKTLNEKAENFSEKLIDELSNYLDLYLEKNLPTVQLEEAVNNTYARRQLNKIKSMLQVDPEAINESVKNVLVEGKNQIGELQNKLNESYIENEALSKEVQKIKSSLVLEQKTRGMNSAKRDYLVKILNDKSSSYIEENFNYVTEMFEKQDSDNRSRLVNEAKKTAVSKDVTPATLVKESVKITRTQDYNPVSEYLSELGRA
jgi:hypothetical protein